MTRINYTDARLINRDLLIAATTTALAQAGISADRIRFLLRHGAFTENATATSYILAGADDEPPVGALIDDIKGGKFGQILDGDDQDPETTPPTPPEDLSGLSPSERINRARGIKPR